MSAGPGRQWKQVKQTKCEWTDSSCHSVSVLRNRLRPGGEWGKLASLATEGRREATPANFYHAVMWAEYNQIFSFSKTLELYIFISYLLIFKCWPQIQILKIERDNKQPNQNNGQGTSLVAQWLRICLPMQGTRVRSLVQEDPTCRRATKPMHHNYWACALGPACCNYWACMLQLLKPVCLEPMFHNKRSHHNEKPIHHNEE